MILEEFMKTKVFKETDYIEYIGAMGLRLEYKEYFLKAVVNSYQLINGCMIIELKL